MREGETWSQATTERLYNVKSEIPPEYEGIPIIFQCQAEPHTQFLAAGEDEVLMSGGRGSGKSSCLLVDPLRYCHKKRFRGLILRKTMRSLRELIKRAEDIYPACFPGVRFLKQEGIFKFPSGAQIEFGYLDSMGDLSQYKGQEYQWVGFDELTEWHDEELINAMIGSVRSIDPDIPVTIRASSNPDGPGRRWVKERFVDLGASGESIKIAVETPHGTVYRTRKWVHSSIYDNKILMESDPNYVTSLASLPPRKRKVWLDGSWDFTDNMAFDEFDRRFHVCEPFDIPSNWYKFRACDWGYGNRSLAVVLWFAVDPDKRVYVYREFVANGDVPVEKKLNAPNFGRKVLEIERGENITYGIIDGSTAQQRGATGPSVYEQMVMVGCRWNFADRSPNSREATKQLVHHYLEVDPHTLQPQLQIFNTCKQLIKELSSLPLDSRNSNDVDTLAEDHAYDALRYGLSSRPLFSSSIRPESSIDTWFQRPQKKSRPPVVNSTVGY